MHSTEIVIARGFQVGSRTSTERRETVPSRGRGVGRLRSLTSRLLDGRTGEAGRALDEVVVTPHRELPIPFC